MATKKPKRKHLNAQQEELGQSLLVRPVLADPSPAAPQDGPFISETTKTLVAKIAKTELFKARAPDPKSREQTVAALELLIERSNSVPAGVFARHLQTREFRVGGVVSNVSSVVNIDGYDVIAHDPVAKVVELNLALLKQGFGV